MKLLSKAAIVSTALLLVSIGYGLGNRLRPVGLAALSNNELAVLDRNNQVALFATRPGARRVTEICSFPAAHRVLDIATSTLGNEEALLITVYWARARRTFVERVSPRAGSVPEVIARFSGMCAGITFDRSNKVAYVVNTLTSDVYSFRSGRGGEAKPQYITAVTGAKQCGPIAVDSKSGRLFIGDPVQGVIFSLDLKTKKARVFARYVGEPRALVADGQGRTLYVADASNRRIIVLPLHGVVPLHPRSWQDKSLREPAGLAMDQGGHLWVADEGTGTLHRLSNNGQVIQTMH